MVAALHRIFQSASTDICRINRVHIVWQGNENKTVLAAVLRKITVAQVSFGSVS